METSDLFKDAYEKLLKLIAAKRTPSSVRLMPHRFPTKIVDPVYGLQEWEFTAQLANTINLLANRLHRLVLWEKIISKYSEREQIDLRFEFTRLIVYFCLHQPYEFKSRLTFAATQLCYIQGLSRKFFTAAKVVPDRDINFRALRAVVSHWKAGEYLLESINSLDSTEFRGGTNNYRNRAQHRVPPGVDFGFVTVIERSPISNGGITYTFGDEAPIKTKKIVPQLVQEAERMIKAFHAYRFLVDEHASEG